MKLLKLYSSMCFAVLWTQPDQEEVRRQPFPPHPTLGSQHFSNITQLQIDICQTVCDSILTSAQEGQPQQQPLTKTRSLIFWPNTNLLLEASALLVEFSELKREKL